MTASKKWVVYINGVRNGVVLDTIEQAREYLRSYDPHSNPPVWLDVIEEEADALPQLFDSKPWA
jgi:hypothetical protein